MSSLYLRIAGYTLAALLFGAIGWHVNGYRWQARYQALQAGDAQARADGEADVRKALQAQLEQAQDVSANNAKVIHELQTQTEQAVADSARDRDLVRRLLAASARSAASSTPVSQAGGDPGAAPAGPASGDGHIGDLLVAVADECRSNARQLNALIEQIQPQL